MYKLQAARMPLHQVDAGDAAVVNLLEELLEIRPALVPNPCIGEKAATCSALIDADAQVDVLAEAHRRETTQLPVEAATDAQIEGTWIEPLVHLFLTASDAASRQEGGHAVADGLLYRSEALVSFVGTAPCITFLPVQLVVDRLQKIRSG